MKKIFATILAALILATPAWPQANAPFKRTRDVIYGYGTGFALTMDVFKPEKPNGAGIIAIVSGGWFSSREAINPAAYQELLKRGYTVFAVVHGSQPKFIITEIVPQIHRAARFIRHNAASYGIDPDRIGVTGGSAGGHLSLMLGLQAENEPPPKSKDPIDAESSAVQCIAAFFPPTDFLNYGAVGVVGDGAATLEKYKPAFGPLADTEEGRLKLGREVSPIYYLSSNLPPTLLIHGDADQLVPLQQSESFAEKAKGLGDTVKVIVKPGKPHGWPDLVPVDMPTVADWFDEHLKKNGAPSK